MASVLYPDYKESCLGGGTHSFSDLTSDDITCALVNLTDDYTYNAAHVDKADVTSYGASTDQVLPTGDISVTAGVFDCDSDLTFTSVLLDVSDADGLVHYMDDGVGAGTSPLICYHDGFSAVTPNGGNITVSYHTSGIFEL